MFKSHPYLRPLLTYSLPPLNLCLLTLTILLLHATLHPTTSAPSYFLRSHGNSSFTTLKIVIHAVSALVGLLNAFHLHRLLTTPAARYDSLKRTLTIHPPHPLPRVRLHHVFILFVCAAAAGYLLIAQLAFTEPFAEMAWSGTCNGYELMAEVEVLPGWYDGSEGSVFGAGSRITYFESVGEQGWREMAVREVVRHYRMEPGFNLYRRGSPERERFGEMAGWGLLDVRLVVGGGGTGEGRYWNETGLVGGGNATMVNGTAVNGTVVVGNATVRGSNGTEVAARGRIGGLRLDLKSSTWVERFLSFFFFLVFSGTVF